MLWKDGKSDNTVQYSTISIIILYWRKSKYNTHNDGDSGWKMWRHFGTLFFSSTSEAIFATGENGNNNNAQKYQNVWQIRNMLLLHFELLLNVQSQSQWCLCKMSFFFFYIYFWLNQLHLLTSIWNRVMNWIQYRNDRMKERKKKESKLMLFISLILGIGIIVVQCLEWLLIHWQFIPIELASCTWQLRDFRTILKYNMEFML